MSPGAEFLAAGAALITDLSDAYDANPSPTITESRPDYGVVVSGGTKWFGGVLHPNGKVYSIPARSSSVLIIDPATDTATLNDYGLGLDDSPQKFGGGVLGPDNRIYGIPRSASDNILVVDPASDTAWLTDMGTDLSSPYEQQWLGGAVGADGRIYCVPYDMRHVLVIDTETQTCELTDYGLTLTGGFKWVGGTLGLDGKLYCSPRGATDVLVIDTAGGTAVRTDFGIDLSANVVAPGSEQKWSSGVLGPDGKIYMSPRDHVDDVLVIDPAAQTAERKNWGLDLTYFNSIAPANGPDGRLYFLPITTDATNFATQSVLQVDPLADEAAFLPYSTNQTNDKYAGAVLVPDGRIYGIPRSASDVLVLDFDGSDHPNETSCRSQWLNKF